MKKQDGETINVVPAGTARENQTTVDFEPLIVPQTRRNIEEDAVVASAKDDAPETHVGELPFIVPQTHGNIEEDSLVASTLRDNAESQIHIGGLLLIVPPTHGKAKEDTLEDDALETHIGISLIVSQTQEKTQEDTAIVSTKDDAPETLIKELPLIVSQTHGQTKEDTSVASAPEDDALEAYIGKPLIVSQTHRKTEEDTPVASTKDDAPEIHIGKLTLSVPHIHGKPEEDTQVASTLEDDAAEIYIGEPLIVSQTQGKTEEVILVACTKDDAAETHIREPLTVSQSNGNIEEDILIASTLQDHALEIHSGELSLTVPEINGKLIEEDTLVASTEDVAPETHIRVLEVQHEDAPISSDWNSASVGSWTNAEPPLGFKNSATKPLTTATTTIESSPTTKAMEKPPPRVYNFFMVKVPRPVDKQSKAEISIAGHIWQDKQDERRTQNDTVQKARAKRNEVIEKRKAALQVETDWVSKKRETLNQIIPLRDSLKKIKEVGRGKSRIIPTSEEDLNQRIASLEWRIEHESIPLKEEKQLIRDIKQLQSSRKIVRANAALIAQVNEAISQREDLENALKPLEAELKWLDSERMAARLQVEKCDQEYDKLNAAVQTHQGQLENENEAYAHHRALKDQEHLQMRDHYNNKREIQEAKLLASKQYNSMEVEALCSAQIERMLEMWNTNDEFRKNYVKDNMVHTVRRFGTLDGRSLGPYETRLVFANVEARLSGPAPHQNGSRASTTTKGTTPGSEGNVETTAIEPAPAAIAHDKPTAKREPVRLPASALVIEVVTSLEELEREAAKLKEQRRAIEMAKAKEAEERKKRAIERNQTKAEMWAQKEAERKQMEKEKKTRKKYVVVAPADSGNSAPAAESQDSALEELKVKSRQRRHDATSTHKQLASRVTKAKAPPIPDKVKQKKLFGMPMQYVVGAAMVVLFAVLVFLYFKDNV